MGTEMTIRSATPDDAQALTTIALEAKRYWGYPEHWIKHWEADLTISPEFIRDNHVYVHDEGGEIRGFYALCVVGDKADLEHMWVTPTAIGTGIGKGYFVPNLKGRERSDLVGIGACREKCAKQAIELLLRLQALEATNVVALVANGFDASTVREYQLGTLRRTMYVT